MRSYPTIGGIPERGVVYAQMMDHLREAQECAALLAHLHNTESNDRDKLIAKGWLLIAELFRRVQHQVTEMAKGKILTS